MSNGLNIEFVSEEDQNSSYDWANISFGDDRVGKARCKIDGNVITIFSINIYPEYSGKGYGREFVNYCKNIYDMIIADRVRQTAIGFWEKEGFINNNDGNWIYKQDRLT